MKICVQDANERIKRTTKGSKFKDTIHPGKCALDELLALLLSNNKVVPKMKILSTELSTI